MAGEVHPEIISRKIVDNFKLMSQNNGTNFNDPIPDLTADHSAKFGMQKINFLQFR